MLLCRFLDNSALPYRLGSRKNENVKKGGGQGSRPDRQFWRHDFSAVRKQTFSAPKSLRGGFELHNRKSQVTLPHQILMSSIYKVYRRFVQIRPAFSSNVLAHIMMSSRPRMSTVRYGEFEGPERDEGREGE
ncbi:hypothetical protein AKJ65_05970 [candidate division MSBL1 archaeon SCGC-AAA259E19]|uniref:Uncharacterized protein n=1 Tax=candidate division MSBL1 archaeon SCGC-AAA259E19 TaxID=1698264 RepID=A0A133UI51_9EURY|nr:hypothetical protein AKJ65_05970 [candidate division MSBL1 archaeon SCGC-AAA259E19]